MAWFTLAGTPIPTFSHESFHVMSVRKYNGMIYENTRIVCAPTFIILFLTFWQII